MPGSSSMTHGRSRARWRTRLAVTWFFVSAVLLVWPVFHWLGNAVRPFVFGLPWAFAYVLGVVLLNFAALVFLYVARWVDAEEPEPASSTGKGDA